MTKVSSVTWWTVFMPCSDLRLLIVLEVCSVGISLVDFIFAFTFLYINIFFSGYFLDHNPVVVVLRGYSWLCARE